MPIKRLNLPPEGKKTHSVFLGCFVKEEFLKITAELKVYLQNTDKTLYLGQYLVKNEGKISDKEIYSTVTKSVMASIQTVKTKESSPMIKEKKLPADAMKSMFNKVKKCKKCMLGLARLNPVFGVGNIKADVVFVGEGPGFKEDHTGEPFVGRSGQLLDKIFESIELSRESVYITNIVKCHPMTNPETPEAHGNDRPPTPEEISTCRHYLEEQIEIIKPKCIVTLGSVAAKILLGEKRGISLLRGRWHDVPSNLFTFSKNIKILPMYHPAALLRNPNLKKDTWYDMKMLKAFLKKSK